MRDRVVLMRVHIRDRTCRHERGSFGGLARPLRVHSCFGDGADAAKRGRLDHGLPIALVPSYQADGAAELHRRMAVGWTRVPWAIACPASWPPVLDRVGSARCRDEPPRATLAWPYLDPRVSPVLPIARVVVAAVKQASPDLDAEVERMSEDRVVGWRFRIGVRHRAGGRGSVTIRTGYGSAWVEASERVPHAIVMLVHIALAPRQNTD
jgi:hypothetical protein